MSKSGERVNLVRQQHTLCFAILILLLIIYIPVALVIAIISNNFEEFAKSNNLMSEICCDGSSCGY